MDTSQIVVALIAALGGGFLGSLAQQWLANRNAEKERAFQAEQRELEFANQEARLKEERYFDIKFQRYDALLKVIIPCTGVQGEKEEDWKKLRTELVNCIHFMPQECRFLFMHIISEKPDIRNLAVTILQKCIVKELETLHFSNGSREELSAYLKKVIDAYNAKLDEAKAK